MRPLRSALALLLAAWCACAGAAIEPLVFQDPAQEARFHTLAAELRCLVCQNQSLADSNAELAADLRRQVYTMLQEGASDRAIIDFMVERYGDFVLYRPPLRGTTYLLWGAPFALLGLGLLILLRRVRRAGAAPAPALAPEERRRLARLLGDERGGGR